MGGLHFAYFVDEAAVYLLVLAAQGIARVVHQLFFIGEMFDGVAYQVADNPPFGGGVFVLVGFVKFVQAAHEDFVLLVHLSDAGVQIRRPVEKVHGVFPLLLFFKTRHSSDTAQNALNPGQTMRPRN